MELWCDPYHILPLQMVKLGLIVTNTFTNILSWTNEINLRDTRRRSDLELCTIAFPPPEQLN